MFLFCLSTLALGRQEAIKLFESGNYAAAQTRFQTLFMKNMSDAEINFYLGRTAFELGQYDRAVAAFERVLIAQPSNLCARLELGRTYFALQMPDEAEAEFKRVLQNPLPAQVRDNVLRYLALIEEGRKKHFYSGSIGLGAQYDSNVKNGSDYEMNIFGDTVNINPKEDGSAWMLSGGLSHRYNPRNDRFQWQSAAQLFVQGYTDVEDSDVRFLSVTTGPLFERGVWSWSVLFGLEHLTFGGESYLLSPSIGVRSDHALAAGRLMSYEYKLQQKRNLIDANEKRDATAHTLSVNHQRLIQEGAAVLSAGGSLVINRKEGGDYRDVSSDALTLRAGYFTKLSAKASLNLNGSVKQTAYPDKPIKISDDNFANHERKDTTLSLGATLGWQLKDRLFAQGGLSWLDNQSSDSYYDYGKQVVTLNLMHTF